MNAVLRPLEDDEGYSPPGVLNEKQAAFARRYVELGGQAEQAAREAGYGDGKYGYQLTRLSHVQAAIRAEQSRLVLEGGAKGLRWMVKALDDAKLPGAVRFQSAKWLAEAAGHGLAAQRAALGLPDSSKPLTEYTLDELDAFISAGKAGIERLKQERERTIEGSASVVRDDARSDDGDQA